MKIDKDDKVLVKVKRSKDKERELEKLFDESIF